MKVKIKKWNGVAVWKWEIDEEVSQIFRVCLVNFYYFSEIIGLWDLSNAI
jgi:hypothetical protein